MATTSICFLAHDRSVPCTLGMVLVPYIHIFSNPVITLCILSVCRIIEVFDFSFNEVPTWFLVG